MDKEDNTEIDPEIRLIELEKELEEERKKSTEYITRLKYLQADFDNYEKRMKRDREDMVKMSSERIVLRILGILDDLELAAIESSKIADALSIVKGLEMIILNIKEMLNDEGVATIDCIGKKLDPLKHDAISFIESSEFDYNVIVRELRKGYLLNGKVIRPSIVEVSRKTVKTTDTLQDAGENK